MTTRLYYDEPYRTRFAARVVSCRQLDGRIELLLDRTAFYPTSGGQPFDTGAIGTARVLEVVDREDGEIAHLVETVLPVGATVEGTIDWPRRFDHMQQHTGQHLLSAAYDRLFGVRTESFHLGPSTSTIDLGREVSLSEIRAAEDEANRIVWEDRTVTIRMTSAEEAALLALRKETLRTGPLRLIDIEGFDLSACGGTHVSSTGSIGIIATTAWEKFRGGSRVEFVCGGRVLARFREWRDAFAVTMRYLSVSPGELGAGIERLQNEARQSQRTIRGLQEQLAVHEARALVERGDRLPDRIIVVEALERWDAAGLKALAAAATAMAPTAAVTLFNHTVPAVVVVARGAQARIDAASVLKALVGKFGGKGGGKADLAQGGGLAATPEELVTEAKQLLRT